MNNTATEGNSLESVQYAVEQAMTQTAHKPEVQDLIARAIKSFTYSMISIVDELPKIKGIGSAEGSELIALVALEALKQDPLVFRKASLKLKGQITFRQQIIDAGGTYSTIEVADLLGISTSAVRKRLECGRLLSVIFGDITSYPVWQFDEKGVVTQFVNTMALLDTSSPVSAFRFFLTHDQDLGCTPIKALKKGERKQLKTVKILAQQFNQQIAR